MKQHIVLVHGACHGAWSWYKLATLLEATGHRVTVPDLAASGIDGRKIEEIGTFEEYSKPLLGIMASLPANEKVVLVGHSLGGISIALAADRFPERVAAVVFVTAFMPDCTNSPPHVLKPLVQDPQYGWLDTEFNSVEIPGGKSNTTMLFGPQFMASKLYQHCSPEDLTLASMLVRPGSLFIEDLESSPAFSNKRYGSIPRFYIMCIEDAAIVKDYQLSMIQNFPGTRVIKIDGADHMTMLSRLSELCQHLVYIVDGIDDQHIS